jgi:hypothetical protein
MNRFRIWSTVLALLAIIVFWPAHAQSRQYYDATMRFNPEAGTQWHYFTTVLCIGNEVQRAQRSQIGGLIWTVYDEEITSSGGGLVGASLTYNVYDSLDLGVASEYEDPTGGGFAPPDYAEPMPGNDLSSPAPREAPDVFGFHGGQPEDLQSIGGGGGGGTGGGASGGDTSGDLQGEGAFQITPILETNINYTMSESGRMLDISGLELIGDIIDPSRSITVRQVFQTTHPLVLPDYDVHLNETWRAPFSWTIPLVGETMEIPLTYRLADLRTTFRFRVAAIDFNGLLQFDVDTSDENTTLRKESNIKGSVILQGRAYVDLDRGVVVAICDTPNLGNTYFVDSDRRGDEQYYNDLGLPWSLNPGFYAQLNFERRDLYTPLGNVVDQRQEIVYKIQSLQWLTTAVVE